MLGHNFFNLPTATGNYRYNTTLIAGVHCFAYTSQGSVGLLRDFFNTAARREMEKGIKRMDRGDMAGALDIFGQLVKKYPRWAEALNKQATALYFLGNARLSFKVCQLVVELKPDHFGAWSVMALCAAQMEKWRAALDAAKKALSLQPSAQGNIDLIQLAQAKIEEEG